jgi:hypothetical protein
MRKALVHSAKWAAHQIGKAGIFGNDRLLLSGQKKNPRVPEGRGGGRVRGIKAQNLRLTSENFNKSLIKKP